jgi:putative transposase
MRYAYKYRLSPDSTVEEELDRHVDVCRQAYNHFLTELREADEYLSRYEMQSMLPEMKEWWDGLSDVYSKVLQMVVKRVSDNVSGLHELKENGYNVGELRWKSPTDYRSLTYNQSGFDVDENTGRDGWGELHLSKIGTVPIRLHRNIPENASIKQVSVKKEKTGEWYATVAIEFDRDTPARPEDPEKVVGIDAGIIKQTHDTDGVAVEPPDLSRERDRLEREQRNLSRKDHGSNNWEKQRRIVARRHADIKRKRRDFLHKLSNYYAREYDLVAVEDLDAKGLVELPGNSRSRASAAWATFLRMLEYKCEREGTHFVAVEPAGTTKECANCGAETEKPLWVREHSCPACGFEADRDANAAWNVLSRGLDHVGVGCSESTPPETAAPADTVVSASRVIERGSPGLKEPPRAASRPG